MEKNVNDYKHIFRSKLTNDPPVKGEPLMIKLKPTAQPFKCKPRKYSVEQRNYLEKFTGELIKAGMVFKNPSSAWASAVHPVKKPNDEGYGATIDLRVVNSMIESLAGLMPFVHELLELIMGVIGFAKYDAFKGFWQCPL